MHPLFLDGGTDLYTSFPSLFFPGFLVRGRPEVPEKEKGDRRTNLSPVFLIACTFLSPTSLIPFFSLFFLLLPVAAGVERVKGEGMGRRDCEEILPNPLMLFLFFFFLLSPSPEGQLGQRRVRSF